MSIRVLARYPAVNPDSLVSHGITRLSSALSGKGRLCPADENLLQKGIQQAFALWHALVSRLGRKR